MKKILLTITLILILSGKVLAGWGDTLLEVDVYIGTPDCTVGTNDYVDSLIEVDLNCKGGIIYSITGKSDSSDDFATYVFDMDIDDWGTSTDKTNETKLLWSYDSSVTSWRDDDPFVFDCDDLTNTESIYIGVYNDDENLTANFWYELKGQCWRSLDNISVTGEE